MALTRHPMIAGCLLGCAVGDAIGLPYEGLSPRRVRRRMRTPLGHSLLGHYGLVSDDTDHSIFVAQALIASAGDVVRFGRALRWRLRYWLACLPAGVGLATLRGILRSCVGIHPSGVFSAGNGPAMRSALIGAVHCNDSASRHALVAMSTRITHTDPKALAAALAVAEIAARISSGTWRSRPTPRAFCAALAGVATSEAWQAATLQVEACCNAPEPLALAAQHFASARGVSGYALHSVPFAMVAWWVHYGDFRATIEACVLAGGDTDTVAAIAGALAGCQLGPEGIPPAWRAGLRDWPHSTAYMARLAAALAGQGACPISPSPWLLPRGLVLTGAVLAHGLARLLPPY